MINLQKDEKQKFQEIIDRVMEDTTFQDMQTIVGKEIAQQAALVSILNANLEEDLKNFPDFKERMEEMKARRIVFKGKLSNIVKPGLIT